MAERARLIQSEQQVFTDGINAYVGVIADKQILLLDINNEKVLTERKSQGRAQGRATSGFEAGNRPLHGLAISGQPLLERGRGAEADQGDAVVARQLIDERRGGVFGRVEPGRGHIGGLHRSGHVHDQDDVSVVPCDLEVQHRHRQPAQQSDSPQHEHGRRNVSPDAWGSGKDRAQQFEVGEAQRIGSPPALRQHVACEQDGNRQEAEKEGRLIDDHAGCAPPRRLTSAERRRRYSVSWGRNGCAVVISNWTACARLRSVEMRRLCSIAAS